MAKALLNAVLGGAQCKRAISDLPLHFAAQSQAGQQGLALMLGLHDVFSSAEQSAEAAGDLPLHLAIGVQTGQHGLAAVKALLEASIPIVARRERERLILPLHPVAIYRAGETALEMVSLLLAAWHEGARHKARIESLPLHWAIQYQKAKVAIAVVAVLWGIQQGNINGCIIGNFKILSKRVRLPA